MKYFFLTLFFFLFTQPTYADIATPSATITTEPTTTIIPRLTLIPTLSVTPTLVPSATPTKMPTPTPVFSNITSTHSATSEATISPTDTPAPTVSPVTPTPLPLIAKIASPTPTQPVQVKAIALVKKINDLFAQPITFPKSFFSNSKQGNFYLSSSLSLQTTNRLLGLSGLLFLAGLAILFGKEVVVFVRGKMLLIWSSVYFFREKQFVLDEEPVEHLAGDIH